MKRLVEIIESGYLNGSGQVLANGTVTSYLAGTSTLQALYEDFDCTTPLANPLTLSAEGRATAYTDTRVKLVFKTSAGATVRTVDNVGTADADLTAAAASNLAGDGLRAPGDGTIAVNPDGVTLELSDDEVGIKDGGVSTAKLAADAVTPAKATPALGPDLIANCVVSCSVAANALTIALKTKAAADASASDPITIGFRSSTLTSGGYNHRTVTAALSTVVASGSTLGHTDGAEWPIYVYALDNAGTVKIAYSTSPVDERFLQTTVDEDGDGDSVASLYSDDVYADCPVRLVAVLKSTQTTAGTWAAVPTAIGPATAAHPLAQVAMRPSHTTVGVGGVALSASSDAYQNATTSFTDVVSATLTVGGGRPVFVGLQPDGDTSNHARIGNDAFSASSDFEFAILRDSTVIALSRLAANQDANDTMLPPGAIWCIDMPSPGTYTYKLQARKTSGEQVEVLRCKLVAVELP